MSENDLKTRYALAKQALADKDFDTAIDLLRRILLEDENYRDASRLLAQVVEHRRRHWYNNPRLWGLGIIIIVIGLLIWLVPKLSLPALIATRPTATITTSPTVALTPTRTPLPARTPPPSTTPVPLAWKRISVGLEFKRDSITAIVVDPKDPDVIYVGSQNAGVYKSIDGGISWKPIQNGLGAGRIDDLDIDLKDPQILYAAVADGGIFKTTDGGESWKQLWAGEFYSTHNVAVAPWDSRVLFQWGGSGNYRSDDGGETFSPIAEGCLAESYFVISQSQPGTLYLSNLLDPFGDSTEGCTGGIYRSTDRGMTWELIGLEGYYQVGGT